MFCHDSSSFDVGDIPRTRLCVWRTLLLCLDQNCAGWNRGPLAALSTSARRWARAGKLNTVREILALGGSDPHFSLGYSHSVVEKWARPQSSQHEAAARLL